MNRNPYLTQEERARGGAIVGTMLYEKLGKAYFTKLGSIGGKVGKAVLNNKTQLRVMKAVRKYGVCATAQKLAIDRTTLKRILDSKTVSKDTRETVTTAVKHI